MKLYSRSFLLNLAVLAAWCAFFSIGANAGIPEPDLVWYGKVSAIGGAASSRVTTGTLVWQIEPVAGGPAIQVTASLTNINDQFSFVVRVPCETVEPGGNDTAGAITLASPPRSYRRLKVTLDGRPVTLIGVPSEISPSSLDRGRTERIDLQLGGAGTDGDGDGLGDDWEQLHFGSLSAKPTDDPDGDGVDNLHEYRAGTNPKDGQSLFELVEISNLSTGVMVRWSSQPGRSYRVRRSADLLARPVDYEVVREGLAATPPFNQFLDTKSVNPSTYFYLIELE